MQTMRRNPHQPLKGMCALSRTLQQGFTLAELIVVMGVIAVMVALGANLGLQTPTSARMRASVGEAASLFEYARELAMAKQVRARVWISHDTKDVEKDLRLMVVAIEDRKEVDDLADEENPVAEWRVESRIKYLSTGVYFQPMVERKTTWDMRSGKEGSGSSWYYYEFEPDGSSNHTGFLLAAGSRPVTGGDVTIANEDQRDGFLIRRNGYLTFLTTPKQVDALIKRTRMEEL